MSGAFGCSGASERRVTDRSQIPADADRSGAVFQSVNRHKRVASGAPGRFRRAAVRCVRGCERLLDARAVQRLRGRSHERTLRDPRTGLWGGLDPAVCAENLFPLCSRGFKTPNRRGCRGRAFPGSSAARTMNSASWRLCFAGAREPRSPSTKAWVRGTGSRSAVAFVARR